MDMLKLSYLDKTWVLHGQRPAKRLGKQFLRSHVQLHDTGGSRTENACAGTPALARHGWRQPCLRVVLGIALTLPNTLPYPRTSGRRSQRTRWLSVPPVTSL